MREIERKLRRQLVGGPERAPLDLDAVVDAARDSRRMRALIALSDDEALHARWARSVDFEETDRFGRAAWVRAPIESVDDRIDAALEGDAAGEVLDLLARQRIGWTHPALDELLVDDETASSAAMVAGVGEPGRLRAMLRDTEVADRAVAGLRTAALSGANELWDQFLIWRDRLTELEGLADSERRQWRRRLDGVGAALDPTLWARGRLAGDYTGEWFGRSPQVADFLQAHGPTDWLEVVGWMEFAGAPSRDLAGTLAVASSAGVGEEPPTPEEAEELVALLTDSDEEDPSWEARASRLGFGLQLAVGEDEFARLLVQVGAHERLVFHGVHSPGIPGLPLSATDPRDVSRESLGEVLDTLMARGAEDDEARVALVRTLGDARVWARRDADVEEPLDLLLERTESWPGEGVALAREALRGLVEPGAIEDLRRAFDATETTARAALLAAADEDVPESAIDLLDERARRDDSVAAMEAGRLLAGLSAPSVTDRLAELWLQGASVERAEYFRRLLLDRVEAELRREGDLDDGEVEDGSFEDRDFEDRDFEDRDLGGAG